MVRTGLWLWWLGDWKQPPTQDDVRRYDPRWLSDLQLGYRLFARGQNKTAPMKIFEEMMAMQGRKNADQPE